MVRRHAPDNVSSQTACARQRVQSGSTTSQAAGQHDSILGMYQHFTSKSSQPKVELLARPKASGLNLQTTAVGSRQQTAAMAINSLLVRGAKGQASDQDIGDKGHD